MEEALEHNSKLFDDLSTAKNQDKILNFSSVGGIVLSQKEQIKKIEKWNSFWTSQKKQFIKSELIAQGSKLGFKPTTYNLFFNHLDSDFKPISANDYLQIK